MAQANSGVNWSLGRYMFAAAFAMVALLAAGAYAERAEASAPGVTTEPTTFVGVTKATVNGMVHPAGLPTTYWFEYVAPIKGESIKKAPVSGGEAGSGSTEVPVSNELSGLIPNQFYYYRVVAENSHGFTGGSWQSFTTKNFAPKITLEVPSLVGGETEPLWPLAVDVDAAGNLYVAGGSAFQKLNSNGEYQQTYLPSIEPEDIQVDDEGNIYIANGSAGMVAKLNAEGETVAEFGRGEPEYGETYTLAVSSAGDVYVAEGSHNRVSRFDANGEYLGEFGSSGEEDGEFFEPCVAVDRSGIVYVVDATGRMQKFTASGEYLGKFKDAYFLPGASNIEVTADGLIYANVGDIEVYDTQGKHLGNLYNYTSTYGFAAEDEGNNVWAGETFNTLTRWNIHN